MVVDVVVGKDVMPAVVGAEVVSAEVETGSVEVMVVNGSSVVTSSEDSCTASYLNKSFQKTPTQIRPIQTVHTKCCLIHERYEATFVWTSGSSH